MTQNINMGHATGDGTKDFADRFSTVVDKSHFRQAQGLTLSSIGIGTYLGKADELTDAGYQDAIVRAVELGSNVIDTAANYRHQRSERAVGRGIDLLIQRGIVRREQIVVCTKGGYVAFDGQAPPSPKGFIQDRFIDSGVAQPDDFVGGHSMAPGYLRNQLEQSRGNLNLDCIDVYYVHNPESQLDAISGEEFYDRLGRAFEVLEQARQKGKILFYGVATWNGFRARPDARGYISLERMVELAHKLGGADHGFRFVQMPFNASMTEAATTANQEVSGRRVSMVEAATEFGITLVASASILQGKVIPHFEKQTRDDGFTGAQAGIQFVRSTPGITTALVGMSRVAHVEENLNLRFAAANSGQ